MIHKYIKLNLQCRFDNLVIRVGFSLDNLLGTSFIRFDNKYILLDGGLKVWSNLIF